MIAGAIDSVIKRCGRPDSMDTSSTSADISDSAIRQELDRILRSPIFSMSDRLCRFLQFTVDTSLAGDSGGLKESVIGVEVYDRQPSYDPGHDSIVRTEARRLRAKLKEYYDGPGKDDQIVIDFRPGSYAPSFRSREILRSNTTADLFSGGPRIGIAVLPFVDLSDHPLSRSCAKSVTEELIHALSHTDGFRVAAATQISQLPVQSGDLSVLADKLDVHFLFEGTVREANGKLRITVRVVTAKGFQIWSQRFDVDVPPDGLFRVTEKIASASISRARPEQSAIRKLNSMVEPSVVAVYPGVVAAEGLFDEGETAAALEKFREMAERAPAFARTYCGMAQCLCEIALLGTSRSAWVLEAAKTASVKAIELDPGMINAQLSAACVHALRWEWEPAEASFKAALNLGVHAGASRRYGLFLAAMRQFDRGWLHLSNAQQIDPFSSRQKIACAKYFFLSRRLDEAILHFDENQCFGPLPVEARIILALTYATNGKFENAKSLVASARRSAIGQPSLMASVAECLALCGEKEESEQLSRDLAFFSSDSPLSLYRQALLSLALGDTSRALRLLSESSTCREAEMVWIAIDPRLDSIRRTSEFARLLEHVMPSV